MEEQVDDDDSGSTELFCGRVMHVLDPQNFWVQIGTQNCFDEFSSLEDSFQEFCEEVGTFPSIPAQSIEEGSYVLVTSPDEAGKCKRAQVARTNKEKGMVDVFYMDYGNTELVTTNRLCQAVPAYFFAVNLELMKCGLAGIRPIAKTWTGRGIKYFEKLTKEHILQAAIVSFKPLEMLNEISLYQQDGDQKSITHLLLEEEIGVPTDVLDSVLEFAKDVTRVLPDSYYEWYNSVEEQDDGNETQETNEVETDYQEETKESEETTKVAEISPQESACYSEDHSPGKSVYSDNNDFETDSCSLSPETPSPAIPSFDLSEILKTTMACPDTLEKKKDDERKKEAKLELQRDIQTICEDVPQPSTSATWEMTDLIIGKNNAHTNDGAISDKIAQIEKVTGSLTEMTKTSPIIPAKKLDGKLPDVSSIVKNGFLLLPTWTTSSAEDSPTECLEKDHSDDDSDDSEDRLVKQMTEIEFFEFSKQLEQILLHSECSDARVVSEEFYRIVPIDGARQPVGLLAALDVLVEHAVKNPDWQGLTLTILDSYCECANFANCLEKILKDSHTRFIRISPGKTLGYHSDFAQVLGQIFLYSRLWATSVSDIIQEYILSACERWVLFNKNNDQIGPRTKRLVEIYNECLVAFWNIAGDLVHDISPTNHRSLQAEVRDRILSDNIDRTLRQRYLLLLLSMLQPGLSLDMSKPVTHDTQCQTDAQSSCSVQVQTDEELAPRLIPYIIPNIKTSRVSNQWKSSRPLAESLMKSPPSTSLTEDLSRYHSWAQCVTDGKRGQNTDPANINELKNLALKKLGSVRKTQSSREIPPRFQKLCTNNRSAESGDSGLHFRDSNLNSVSDSGSSRGKCANSDSSSKYENTVDWFEGGRARLNVVMDTPVSKSGPWDQDDLSNRRRYDSCPQTVVSGSSNLYRPDPLYGERVNPVCSSNDASLPASRNSSELDSEKQSKEGGAIPVMRDTSASSRKTLESPFMEDVGRVSDNIMPAQCSAEPYITNYFLRHSKEKAKSRSESPLSDIPSKGNKRESVKCVDSVSEKYLPSRLRKSNKASVKKGASPASVGDKDPVIDWWEAGDSKDVTDSQTSPLACSDGRVENVSKGEHSPVPGHVKQSPAKSAKESLLSIVQDVLGSNKSPKTELFTEYDGQASVGDTSGDDVESWSESEADGKNMTNVTDQHNLFTQQHDVEAGAQIESSDVKPMRVIPQYISGLDFEDEFDDDDYDDSFLLDFKDVDYAKIVDESLNSGSGAQHNSPVMTGESPKKPVRTYQWVPGKRRCTMCSSFEHVAYSCPQRAKHQIL